MFYFPVSRTTVLAIGSALVTVSVTVVVAHVAPEGLESFIDTCVEAGRSILMEHILTHWVEIMATAATAAAHHLHD